jgi:hypothetical protein
MQQQRVFSRSTLAYLTLASSLLALLCIPTAALETTANSTSTSGLVEANGVTSEAAATSREGGILDSMALLFGLYEEAAPGLLGPNDLGVPNPAPDVSAAGGTECSLNISCMFLACSLHVP